MPRSPPARGRGRASPACSQRSPSTPAPARRSSPGRGLGCRSGELVPADELALLARVSDMPAPGVAGGNQRLAEALADAVGRERINLGEPVRAIVAEGDGVVIATNDGSFEADRCVIAVPATVIDRIELRPALPAATEALAWIAYGHAAKLFVPLPGPVPPSATLAVPDRYWAGPRAATRTGPRSPSSAPSRVRQRRSSASPSNPAGAWVRRLARCVPTSRSIPPGRPLDLGRRPWVARRLLGRDAGRRGGHARPPARPARLRRRASRRRDQRADGGRDPQRRSAARSCSRPDGNPAPVM